MAVIEGGVSAALAGVGVESASPQHVASKAIPVGALGHYRTSHRTVLVASQAANSRLFEIRNIHATNLLVVTRIRIELIQTAAMTAAILNSLDVFRCTGFSAVDTTGTVTPTFGKMRTSFATAVDGTDFAIRGVTVAGAAGGMTGGTLVKDTAPLRQVGLWHLALLPTAGPVPTVVYDFNPAVGDGEHPLVLVQNEGFIIESRVALGVAAGAAVSIDVAFANSTAY